MNIATPMALGIVIGLAALTAPVQTAEASLNNAALACYVDTYAYDELSEGYCFAAWTPWTAPNPSVAYFSIIDLPPGNYQFQWSISGCGNAASCSVSIGTEQQITATATILDLDTSTFKQVSATAEYIDGWH